MTRKTVGSWHGGRYVGMWHGGASYGAPYAEDAEWFRSIGEAIGAVRERRNDGAWCRVWFRYVFRANDCTLTPCAHDGNSGSLVLFRVSPEMTPDDIREMCETGYPDRIVEFGPRGGIVVSPA